MKEMIEKEMKKITFAKLTEEFKEMNKEDRELYLFLRGGFTAK